MHTFYVQIDISVFRGNKPGKHQAIQDFVQSFSSFNGPLITPPPPPTKRKSADKLHACMSFLVVQPLRNVVQPERRKGNKPKSIPQQHDSFRRYSSPSPPSILIHLSTAIWTLLVLSDPMGCLVYRAPIPYWAITLSGSILMACKNISI